MGQIEGAFVQGIWFFMLEEYKTNSDGLVTADSTWRYKVPTIDNIPKQFNVEILSSGHHQNRVLSSKGIPSSVTVGLEEHSSVPFCEAGTEEDHGKPGDKNKMKHVMDSGIMTRSKELEKDVSPVKKARTEVSVIPPSTPGSNMIVLDGESREMVML
ncbi:unnamed protein product [Linum trigynum]|uniref:Aldehyde oxidase/xanthine dehydrogenase second molybdopterin binding domain-containing protein n=1 Tax=Linum trigynum TaxID=586398 RepID=A0AAV2E077_9ROSI